MKSYLSGELITWAIFEWEIFTMTSFARYKMQTEGVSSVHRIQSVYYIIDCLMAV